MTYLNIHLNTVYPSSTRYTSWPLSLLYSYSYFVDIFYLLIYSSVSPLDEREYILYYTCIMRSDMIFEQ